MFRYVVLGLLRDGGRRHGYALMKRYRCRTGLHVNTGNFYRELQRLVCDGLVRSATPSPDGDPRRAPYEISHAGIALFDEWFSAPLRWRPTGTDDELTIRILFLSEAPRDVARARLAAWQDVLWRRMKELESERDAALAGAERDGAEFPVLPLLLTRRMKHVAADLELLEELRRVFEQWARPSVASSEPAVTQQAARRTYHGA
jgi:DNA-binding PadR family transcriptional regulator